MNGAAAITTRGLCFSYDRNGGRVLDDLSLAIPARAVTAILGPNGSGKTTLLHLLLGILAPSAGSIELAGKQHGEYSRRGLSQTIGLVPQDEHVPFDLSVVEYVLLGRAPYLGLLELPGPQHREVALRALAATGMIGRQQRLVPSLSGGERQLVTVARALAQEPGILLLDEPISHLDLSNRRRILQVLSALAEDGVTVVFTTHDPNAAASTADHVILLRDGRSLAAGPLETVLTTENLTATYDVPVEVTEVNGRRVVLAL